MNHRIPTSTLWRSGAALLAGLLAVASSARAQDASLDADLQASLDDETLSDTSDAETGGESPAQSRANLGLVLGGKVGGGLGAPFSDFGATPVLELELGYMLPVGGALDRHIQLFVTGQYVQPTVDGTASDPDPRLPGDGIVRYEVTQQELALSLGALYRFDLGTQLLMPYGGLGGRMYLLNTKVKGSAGGVAYGENEETQTDFGLVLLGGVDIFLGPGALLAELSFGWAALDGFVMRDTNLGALNLAVGYRLML